ncbi:hypothetical protein H0I39_10890 [Ottowia beijingensis]|uniref:Uncharacterized protein n=1 Tax=Ottowia beijingensis TaxID=1207057 RepID=A0A853IY22_9BURK|nr:hypothetical protein [Ottowia beijingensis]NZA02128.1 hypothetical protein [Ottowia beijingensis]
MRYTYIFIGLTPSERALLESLMALDSGGGDELVPVATPEEANLIVVNGDDASVVDCLRAGNPQALIVLVGQPPRSLPLDLPVLRRPLGCRRWPRCWSSWTGPKTGIRPRRPA